MPYADLPGVRLFYTDTGTGSPVLLGGGAPATGAAPQNSSLRIFAPQSGNTVVALISSMLNNAVTLNIFTSDISA